MIDVGPVLTIDLPLRTYCREFLRTDKHAKRTERPISYHASMLRRWAERLVGREAARLGAGLAHTSPAVEIERSAALRGTTFVVYIDFAFIPGCPAERLLVEDGHQRIRIPALTGVTAHD